MRIGVLLCAYDCADLLYKCITPWLSAKELFKDDQILISVAHGQYKEYHDNGLIDNDLATLDLLKNGKWMDNLYIQNDPAANQPPIYQHEYDIQNYNLQYLIDQGCDYLWLLGHDEIYSLEQIYNTIKFVKENELIGYFRIEFKNLVFNNKTYIKGFSPPRIFKRKFGNFEAFKVYHDDEINYKALNGEIKSYKELGSLTIPINLCNPLHYTWLSDERSKNKVKYQKKRWGAAGCSFSWDEVNNKLEWNFEYFERTGQDIPELFNI